MGSQEVLVDCGVYREGEDRVCVEQQSSEYGGMREDVDMGRGNIAEEVLVNLEEYLEDINDRLMISRMVSDSVIKGMVGAVEQLAAEKIAAREFEVASSKKLLNPHEAISDKYLDATLTGMPTGRETPQYLDHLMRQQFDEIQREIAFLRKSDAGKNSTSSSKLVECECCSHIDEKLEHLKTTVDFVHRNYDEWQSECSLLTNVEDVVVTTVLRGHQEELQANLQEYNSLFSGVHYVDWIEKFKGVSHVCTQLDEILKTLSIPGTGLFSHGSHDLDQGNGKLDPTYIHVAESYDYQQLSHFNSEDLVDYFNGVITTIKRDHEKIVEQKTEQYYSLKREYLKMASFMTHKHDSNDLLKKKITDLVLKLDEFLLENERFPALKNNLESIGELKQNLGTLLSENQYLKECLTEKEHDIRCLQAEVSDLKEQIVNSDTCEKAVCASAEKDMLQDIEALNFESSVVQEFSGLVFAEAMKDVERQFNELYKKILMDREIIFRLETKVNEKEHEIQLQYEEMIKLRQDILDLGLTWEKKELHLEDLLISLEKDWKQFELASHELSSIREDASRLHTVVRETNRVLDFLKTKHSEGLKQIEAGKIEISRVNLELAQAKMLIARTNYERNNMEETLKKVLEMGENRFLVMIDDFESQGLTKMDRSMQRLENACFHLKTLSKARSELKKTEIMYKKILERRCADLQLAEAEVDLLGDQVDALLHLLEKIYIALKHYSPVLKHYPGIVDILELVRRELSGESTKIH